MIVSRQVHPSVSKTAIPLDAEDLPTVCVLCSHNCGIRVDVRDGRITAVRGDERNPITEGYICNKAVTVDRYAHHGQRVEQPLRRRAGGEFERVSWDDAIPDIAAKLRRIRDQHGPRAIGLVGIGGQANHMDAPYASSFLRAIGSRRWFNAYAQEKTQHHLIDGWMFDASPTVFFHPDMEHARYLIVMGTNPRISNRGHNPNETFKALAKREDCTVVVVDPRETETTRGADRHLRVRPGTDAYLLTALAAVIVQNDLYDAAFLERRSIGFNEVRDVLARIDVEEMAARCGLDKATVVETATGLARAGGGAIMFDLGVEQTPFSTLISYLIRLNLALTGNVGRAGGNIFLEGILPPTLSPGRHAEPERALASGIAAIRALGNFGMFSPSIVPEEIMLDHPERIRALIVEGSNPLLSYSDTGAWRRALARLELLVVIDPAFTETARMAHYVLPTPCGYEKWEIAAFPKRYPQIDTQLRPPVVPGPADALPEPEIYARLVDAMQVLDPLPEQLAALAQPETAEARALFLMTAMSMLPDLGERGINGESQLLFWAYRAIGHHFPAPSLVAIWAQSQANAAERREAVLRTFGARWNDASPLDLGEEVFRRILAHPEGVEVACVDPADNLDAHLGYEDKRIRLAPEAMITELERAIATTPAVDPDYPFVMASGLRTRWTANTIQRDPAWRKARGPHCEINVAPADAERLGITKGDIVRIETRVGAIELPAAIDAKLAAGHCWMPNGFGVEYGQGVDAPLERQGANCNEITDAADRDPFTACPHHRYVRVRLVPAGGVAAA
jgi:anaerobic selenocysteine-containing dehydrogenase